MTTNTLVFQILQILQTPSNLQRSTQVGFCIYIQGSDLRIRLQGLTIRVFNLNLTSNTAGEFRTHWHAGIKVVPEAGSETGRIKDGAAVEEHGLDEEHLPGRKNQDSSSTCIHIKACHSQGARAQLGLNDPDTTTCDQTWASQNSPQDSLWFSIRHSQALKSWSSFPPRKCAECLG